MKVGSSTHLPSLCSLHSEHKISARYKSYEGARISGAFFFCEVLNMNRFDANNQTSAQVETNQEFLDLGISLDLSEVEEHTPIYEQLIDELKTDLNSGE
jgi:hypothetical protein